MTTIGFARPPWLGEEPAVPDRGPHDPLASASAALGVLAVAAATVHRLHLLGIPAAVAAILLALASWRRSRSESRPPRLTAWAGLLLAVVAGVGLIGAPAAFGSIADSGGTTAPPPAPAAVSAASPDASASTADVLSRDITVSFGTPYTTLDDTGLVMATLPVSVKNITDSTASYNLQFAARDAQGNLITTDSAFVPNVTGGQTAQIRVFNIVNNTMVPKLMNAHYSVTQATIQ